MTLKQFKQATPKPKQIKEYGKTLPMGSTRDDNGNILSYKDSNGDWYECTYDKDGNTLTSKNSGGDWWEYTYDDNGNILTHNRGRKGDE